MEKISFISSNSTECLPECAGILVTSYSKTENKADSKIVARKLMEQYNEYKQFAHFQGELKGDKCQLT